MVAISVWVLTAYRRVDIALLLPLVSGGRLSRVWPARPTPALFPFLSLSFYFTHLQPDGLLAEMEYSQGRNILLVKTRSHQWRQALKTYSQEASSLATSLRVHRRGVNGAPVAEGLPEEANAIGDSRKNDRDRNTLLTGNSLHNSRRSIPGKIWMPTNQIRAISARAHVYRELRARALQASRGI